MSSGNGASYPSPKQSSLLLSRGKGTCVPTAFEPSIEILPDECLFEVFKRLPNGQERNACACVSKRWLTLLSRDDTFAPKANDKGYLTRRLAGRYATDIRLAAIAVGTANCGGLAKLYIRGNNILRGVTDAGLKAIARGCPTLEELSLWNVSSVGDEGLSEIAHGCHLLEKLDLILCPAITDMSLLDVARNCPQLNSLSIQNCPGVGNATIAALGRLCHNLNHLELSGLLGITDDFPLVMAPCCSSLVSLAIRNCPGVGNATIAVVGRLCHSLTHLELSGLLGITNEGLCPLVMAPCCNSLLSLAIRNCPRVGNATIDVVGRMCHNLMSLDLSGLHGITDEGLFPLVQSCVDNLVVVNLSGCVNVTDISVSAIVELHGGSLKSLILDGCRHVTDATLAEISNSCWILTELDVSRCGITDSGIKTLASAIQFHLRTLSLSGCPLVSDNSLPFLDDLVQDLQSLNILQCPGISSRTIDALVEKHQSCHIFY